MLEKFFHFFSLRHYVEKKLNWKKEPFQEKKEEKSVSEEWEKLLDETLDTVMIPRSDMIALSISMRLDDIIKVFLRTGFQWLPVFRNTLDTIAGILSIQAVLALRESPHKEKNWHTYLHQPAFYPSSSKIRDIIYELVTANGHFAIFVVDEYGGIEGMITRNKIFSTLFHHCQKDGFKEEECIVSRHPFLVIRGRMDMETFSKELGISNLVQEDEDRFHTLGGWICTYLERVPLSGEIVHHPSGLILEIRHSTPRRVLEVAVLSTHKALPLLEPSLNVSSDSEGIVVPKESAKENKNLFLPLVMEKKAKNSSIKKHNSLKND